MGLYRVYKKGEERGTNWVVMADDTDAAKLLVCQHIKVSHPDIVEAWVKALRVGFLDNFEKDYITVRVKQSYYWGLDGWQTTPLKEVEKIWKHSGKTGVVTTFKP